MVGWHHRLSGHGFGDGVGDGQGGLACCGSWGHKESDTTERLDWTELWCGAVFPFPSQLIIPLEMTQVCLSKNEKENPVSSSDFDNLVFLVILLVF